MTIREFNEILQQNNIPDSVLITSNSGWECGWTDVGGIYYLEKENRIELTQSSDKYEDEYHKKSDGWKNLIPEGER